MPLCTLLPPKWHTQPRGHQVKDLFVLNLHPNSQSLQSPYLPRVSAHCCFQRNGTQSTMQRAFFSRSALLAQNAAAAFESPLAARCAPVHQRLDRSMSSVTIPPPACMLRPLEVPQRHLFGPGPSNVPPRILAASSRPIIGHLHPEMYEVNALRSPELKQMLKSHYDGNKKNLQLKLLWRKMFDFAIKARQRA